VFLQSLDSFCNRRLGNKKRLRGDTQVAVPGGVIENLELVEIHLIITFSNQVSSLRLQLEWWNDGILEYWVSELHRIEKYHDS
jgi:hypothetical protein